MFFFSFLNCCFFYFNSLGIACEKTHSGTQTEINNFLLLPYLYHYLFHYLWFHVTNKTRNYSIPCSILLSPFPLSLAVPHLSQIFVKTKMWLTSSTIGLKTNNSTNCKECSKFIRKSH